MRDLCFRRDTLATFLPFLCLRLLSLCKRRVRLPPFDGPPCIPRLAACICANWVGVMLIFTGVCTGVEAAGLDPNIPKNPVLAAAGCAAGVATAGAAGVATGCGVPCAACMAATAVFASAETS